MFEEVPRERRGVARMLPIRRVVLGPFVLGGGMLLAALGGSVAVAAAATMITASALGSDDLPARPSQAVAASSSPQASLSARQLPARRPVTPATGQPSSAPSSAALERGAAGGTGAAGGASATGGPGLTGIPVQTATVGPPASDRRPTAAPSTPAGSPTPAPSSSPPLGNALIHVSGYDQASGRLAYQFATVTPQGGVDGGDLYLISGPDTFTAVLATSVTITSGGSICPPAGSMCTPDQVIRAAAFGFFAEVAIDAAGELRSIIEVGDQSVAAKLLPVPSTTPTPQNSRRANSRSSSPPPSASPATTS
ncbi:MAG: hypothetical protein ABI047_05155 [Jatrophihabitantaceae bacterium]